MPLVEVVNTLTKHKVEVILKIENKILTLLSLRTYVSQKMP